MSSIQLRLLGALRQATPPFHLTVIGATDLATHLARGGLVHSTETAGGTPEYITVAFVVLALVTVLLEARTVILSHPSHQQLEQIRWYRHRNVDVVVHEPSEQRLEPRWGERASVWVGVHLAAAYARALS